MTWRKEELKGVRCEPVPFLKGYVHYLKSAPALDSILGSTRAIAFQDVGRSFSGMFMIAFAQYLK